METRPSPATSGAIMALLEIFDPLRCCAGDPCEVGPRTGVHVESCRFHSELHRLAARGVHVRRSTLADAPHAFVEQDVVRFLLTVLGERVLPIVLVDGQIRAHGRYPEGWELALWAGLEPAAEVPPAAPARPEESTAVLGTVTAPSVVETPRRPPPPLEEVQPLQRRLIGAGSARQRA
ncbi:arsenic metallochaperone ArsD family protein [Actinotalea sp. K2]|uniref:arsenic metallochaperone ArsD family protein n=1 Tax=Actinotalea sp. K2 TaxID=2939438 RepID=UPI002017129E|nr:arsenic metallochaperone ArsD family protein [Actinotalea sp. K2]MCL3860407.1 arsenic metallochaperone ArsD family protein [Actinotalea sp. K2]